MTLPTEPIGSIPRPAALLEGMQAANEGKTPQEQLDALFDDAVRDTAFAKIQARITGNAMASSELGV